MHINIAAPISLGINLHLFVFVCFQFLFVGKTINISAHVLGGGLHVPLLPVHNSCSSLVHIPSSAVRFIFDTAPRLLRHNW